MYKPSVKFLFKNNVSTGKTQELKFTMSPEGKVCAEIVHKNFHKLLEYVNPTNLCTPMVRLKLKEVQCKIIYYNCIQNIGIRHSFKIPDFSDSLN